MSNPVVQTDETIQVNNRDAEVWLAIPGYEGRYEVSNLGRVASLNYARCKKRQVLKPRPERVSNRPNRQPSFLGC
ncbi:hypothetical protein I8752_29025 [Nostocaceae cyanobacterium CENA369]|uniref:NUMOD4 domain-containing protein n=1 Tax=Dendronalium phyllosphericum CENA369 TaxID=1725256 RepID=A0A8J7I8T8_9NOST|nr:NUMOD4 domain-containing protein [Dendronalium phyllosphericum]MBH8576955.1 hypothetical protein [Dendronalium phyllosphericum CENA369]